MTDVETERLLLRGWRPDDLDDLAEIFRKEEVWWYPFKRGWGRDETEEFLERRIAEWATRGWSLWAVEVKGERKLIGYLGLAPPEFLPEVMPTVEIGWRLDPAWWGRGFATEGGRAALAYGFEVLDLDEIVGIYEPENRASGRVMNRLGMTPWRDATHPTLDVPLRVYRIMRNEWCAV
jgi:RimJ/RimL family protein N-acetyltransferase